MGGEVEAVGEALTGTVVAATVEGAANVASADHDRKVTGPCRNCGATLTGAYCVSCGQAAHLHRSLLSLGHDILHGVFHFEGKVWRTIPELFFHPGRLTRRYIDGERAKFVSPMALFLFTVFLMFAVFSFTGGMLLGSDSGADGNVASIFKDNWESGFNTPVAEMDREIEKLQAKLAKPDLSEERRAKIQRDIEDTQLARNAVTAFTSGNWGTLAELEKEAKQRDAAESEAKTQGSIAVGDSHEVTTGWAAFDRRATAGLKELNDNPRLLLYKVKTNGYKLSWLLVPMSIPFLWLLFFWRRDVHLYDHAIFVTYSISFIMLLVILCSIAAAVGVSDGIWGTALILAPPIHMYKQLRGAYGLSRFGALVRLFLLQIAIVIVLSLFGTLLLMMGMLG